MAESSANSASLPEGRSVWLVLAALVVLAAVGATAFPLLVYSVSLAVFGLAHVGSELRYVDTRFGARVGGRLRVAFALLLVGVVGLRGAAALGHAVPHAKLLELLLVVGLCCSVLPLLAQRDRGVGGASALVVVGFALLAWGWPLEALFVLAFTHNLTPVGFLAERLRGRDRRVALALCALVFGVVPGVIATGWPLELAFQLSVAHPDASVLPTVHGINDHLGAYLPPGLDVSPLRAISLFSAAVFLQCMHYLTVIYVLPRLDRESPWTGEHNALPWPSRGAFAGALVVGGTLLGVGFWFDFTGARSGYGVVAAVHAWVELPLLLLALGVPAEGGELT